MEMALAWASDSAALVLRGASEATRQRVRSLGPDASQALPVHPADVLDDDGESGTLQPVPGRYSLAGDDIVFTPRFPFLAGTAYALLVRDEGAVLRIDRPAVGGAPTAEVVLIEPTAATLPRNALRLYVHFSAAMSEGEAARHVRLVRSDDGSPVVGAFSPMEPELWDSERRRLTVLLDPARIKRGLVPHDEAGYPLVAGASIDLVVDAAFRDAAGRPLVAEARRTYAVGPDLRTHVDPTAWSIEAPARATRDALVVRFDRPLDRGLLDRCLSVLDADGGRVRGSAEVARGEEAWHLHPDRPWAPGPHRLVVEPILEDLAGNSVRRVFDRDLAAAADDPLDASGPVVVAFTPA